MKKHVSKWFFILLVVAVVAGMGSCALFGGDTNLAIGWYGAILHMYGWNNNMPSPFNVSSSWTSDTYYKVEPGSYYGEYALDIDANGIDDYGWYGFDLEIKSKLFSERDYYLYLSYDGAYLFMENNVPAPRILEPDGSWTSSITTDDGVITLKSKAIAAPAPSPSYQSKSK